MSRRIKGPSDATRVRCVKQALASILVEADAYRAKHPSGAEPDYASGPLSAVHDICDAAGLEWPRVSSPAPTTSGGE